jgi:hypothetical protein
MNFQSYQNNNSVLNVILHLKITGSELVRINDFITGMDEIFKPSHLPDIGSVEYDAFIK